MTTRWERITALEEELRELYGDIQADIELAAKYGCKVEDLDRPNSNLGFRSPREVDRADKEVWGDR
jgi:hypothetical protein